VIETKKQTIQTHKKNNIN